MAQFRRAFRTGEILHPGQYSDVLRSFLPFGSVNPHHGDEPWETGEFANGSGNPLTYKMKEATSSPSTCEITPRSHRDYSEITHIYIDGFSVIISYIGSCTRSQELCWVISAKKEKRT
jgi:hypothetical protein